MAREDVIVRAIEEIKHGHTHAATQRLRALIAAEPEDTFLRGLLAEAYRQAGNLVEAGRWAYLTRDLRADERAAFERAHQSPWLRLRVLRYPGDGENLPREPRERLSALIGQAERDGPPPRLPDGETALPAGPGVDEPERSLRVPCLVVLAGMVMGAVFAAIGIYRLLTFLFAI